jgi:gamma-glutamyltranspeptidase/glutathione hydrolase
VVEPYFSHVLGGGVWALYYEASSGSVTALDGVGPAGSLITREDYASRSEQRGIHQANVPGAWDGWMLWLERYGALELADILAPAIRLARDGFAISSEMAYYMSLYYDEMLAHPPTAALYAPNGVFPEAGAIQTMPGLATTFEQLAAAWAEVPDRAASVQAARDYVYRGPLAEAIVADSDAWGGYLTQDDFAGFAAEIVDAISISYGSTMRVYQNPPNSQGVTMLLALNILKGIDQNGLTSHHPDVIHAQVEAIKLAFADRNAFIGDPAVIDIDLDELLSDEHAAEQLARIDMSRAMAWPETAPLTQMTPENTTTFQVTDRWGNAASVTTSIGLQFRVIGDTGIHINERMRFYSTDPASPNVVAPGKKVRHTSCPYLVLRNERPFVIGGSTGVDTQPQAQLQQLMSAIDFGMSAQEAISLPRWVSTAFEASTVPYQVGNTLQLQYGFPDAVIADLQGRGHDIVIGTGVFGSGGMIKLSDDSTSASVGVELGTSMSSGRIL